jgi:hypothetical protein
MSYRNILESTVMNETISSTAFGWHEKHGSVWISDLPWMGPVSVFKVVSNRTGVTMEFSLDKVERDGEGEIQSWEYSSPNGQIRITIFND